jgi:choline dehydrogenase-like flavoprotein
MEPIMNEVSPRSDSDLLKNKTWDFIVVGTGMGGGPLGLRLAQAGFSVLFIEKGSSPKDPDTIRGEFPELKAGDQKQLLKKGGRFHQAIHDVTSSRHRQLTPFIGQGVGGSSALYGMVLDRFHASDFKTWPLSYEEFSKYYEEAETLFKVKKGLPYRHPGNRKIEEFLKETGWSPYPLPLANDDHPSCGNCQSVICAFKCKNDSGKICIEPAVDRHGAGLLTECEVERIESSGSQVTGVTVRHQGERKFISARNVVLSAGAIQSPVLLMKSATEAFPSGLGNQSGYLGRNLMRHFVDLYALEVDSEPENKHSKEIGFNLSDQQQGKKLGTVQSFGRLPPVEVILLQLEKDIPFPFLRPFFRLFKPMLRVIIGGKVSGTLVLASIMEDSPQFENRVWTEDGKVLIHYRISSEDRNQIGILRQKLKALFKPLGLWFIPSSEKNEMLAHACGTCRMGDDPKTSVVDRENRVHGLGNLYVVDGSFFPTSGETNPALTIAANSLRVADILIRSKTN